jgi:hypothetical protein
MNNSKFTKKIKQITVPTPSNQKTLPATWLVKKYALVKWEKDRRGLVFSIVKRTEFTNQLGLEVFDTRTVIQVDHWNLPRKYKCMIFAIGMYILLFSTYLITDLIQT